MGGPELVLLANTLLFMLVLTILMNGSHPRMPKTTDNADDSEDQPAHPTADYSGQTDGYAAITAVDDTDFAFFLQAGEDLLNGPSRVDYGHIGTGQDAIDGGSDADPLFLAGADMCGDGNDLFVVYDSENPDNVVEITDFVKGKDTIELQFDGGDEPPEFAISIDEDTQDATITLDGVSVLKVTSAANLTAEDITLAAA